MPGESSDVRNQRLVEELGVRLADDAATVMIFLGAGLSFGVGRRLGRGSFETPPPIDDDSRFPSWMLLVDRMKTELKERTADDWDRRAYDRFAR
ncbi:MAG TPA: hypothetical protein VGV57_05625, partial [Thermoleophilaceae bacterium]|nr:hypothetical protein [Thermoleophilaceae bacterium]